MVEGWLDGRDIATESRPLLNSCKNKYFNEEFKVKSWMIPNKFAILAIGPPNQI